MRKARGFKAHHINGDMTDIEVIRYLLNQKRFDSIVSNPPFHLAFEALALAQYLVKPDGVVMFLLPSAFFASSTTRQRLYDDDLDLIIVKELVVGRWDYFGNGTRKATPDSVFIFKKLPAHGRAKDKFSWNTRIVDTHGT